jgi:hypothetical protein
MKDEPLRRQMGARGKPKAMQYDWTLIARRVLDFYTQTLDRIKRPEVTARAAAPPVSVASGKH